VHTLPAGQGLDVAVVLPALKQKPAVHAAQLACAVYKEPPTEKKPAGQRFVVPTPCPATQKEPGGHGTCVTLAKKLGQ